MFRAAKNPVSSGKETRNMTNNNLADIQGVLRYLHQEIVVEHAQGDPQRTERKYGIDSIARYRVSVRNPNSIDAKAPILGFSPAFTAFDYGVTTNGDSLKELAQVGDFVGIQRHDQSDVAMIVAYPYYWFSLPGLCPNLPWTCIKGSSKPNCPKKASDVGVVPQVCQDRGCAGKKDEEAQKCQANFSDPDSLGDCCLRYSNGDEKEQVVIQGGLCEGPPTGQHGCVYSYPALEDKDVMSLDELVGIPSMKCGASGERACTDWADWRKNCYDPENKYKKRFQKTDNPDKTMKVEVVATDYCVEYDLHPYCQDREGLCTNVDCQGLTDSEKEIGLPFWLGRCEEGQNTKRAEAIARKALGQENLKNHVMVDKELLTSNFKCGSGSGMCKPNPDGGPYCSRQFGGVCTPCYIPGTKLPFQNAAQFVTCPFDVLAIGGYTPPQGTECKSQDAADICCLYGIGGGCSKSYADGSSADLTVAGFLGVMAASLKDPDQMYNFAVHWIQENGGKVEKEDQLKEEVYWMWRIHPSKRAAEEWDKFQENLKASSAVSFPDEPGKPTDEPGEPTEEPPGETTVSPGAQTTPSPGPDDEPPARPFPIWTIVAAVGAAAFLVAGWFYLYRNPNQRRGSSVEEDRRSLQMSQRL